MNARHGLCVAFDVNTDTPWKSSSKPELAFEGGASVEVRLGPVEPERIERMVSGIVRRLENMGEGDIRSQTIGRLVMEALKGLDDVAYVRFASVYKNFREAKDFEALLGELAGTEGEDVDVDSDEAAADEN